MDNMIKLPKGVTVHIGVKKFGGAVKIPVEICPVRWLPKSKQTRKPTGSGEADV